MKSARDGTLRTASVLLRVMVPLLSEPSVLLGATSTPAPLRSYPWSERSAYTRVDKNLLSRGTYQSVVITNVDSMQFVLTPEFVVTLLLTHDQIERVNTALTNALHSYRTVQCSHYVPLHGEDVFESALGEFPYPSGSFRFRLKPFETEAGAIRQRLKSDVLAALGPQRAELFWLRGRLLEGEMKHTNHFTFAGETHYFSLLSTAPGPLVDITVRTSGGHQGRPFGAALDRYAPAQLKPILQCWRAWIADQPPGSFRWTTAGAEHKVIAAPAHINPSPWDEAAEYAELPKSALLALGLPGLTDAEELSAEATAVLGLNANQAVAVSELYRHMKDRVEKLERANLVFPSFKQKAFVLRAFPQAAATLKQEWLNKLAVVVGTNRATLLDQFVRTPQEFDPRQHAKRNARGAHWFERGPRWFDRGMFEMRITVAKVIDASGRDSWEIDYKSDRPESGSTRGPQLVIPDRFRHLLTPAMLKEPESFWLQP